MSPIPLVLLVGGALLAGGCGDDGRSKRSESKRRYEKDVRAAVASVEAESELNRSSGLDVDSEFVVASAAGDLDALAVRLDAIEPPAEVAGAHDAFIAALRAQASELKAAVRASTRGRPAALERLVTRGGRSPEIEMRLAEAFAEFKAKGYDVTASGAR